MKYKLTKKENEIVEKIIDKIIEEDALRNANYRSRIIIKEHGCEDNITKDVIFFSITNFFGEESDVRDIVFGKNVEGCWRIEFNSKNEPNYYDTFSPIEFSGWNTYHRLSGKMFDKLDDYIEENKHSIRQHYYEHGDNLHRFSLEDFKNFNLTPRGSNLTRPLFFITFQGFSITSEYIFLHE